MKPKIGVSKEGIFKDPEGSQYSVSRTCEGVKQFNQRSEELKMLDFIDHPKDFRDMERL